MKAGDSYYKYVGTAGDSLCPTYDSILYPIKVGADRFYKFSVGAYIKKKSGNDSTVWVSVYGKQFEDGSWTKIGTSGKHSLIINSATGVYVQYDYGTAVQYRYIRIDLQMPVVTSKGAIVNYVELKTWGQ